MHPIVPIIVFNDLLYPPTIPRARASSGRAVRAGIAVLAMQVRILQ